MMLNDILNASEGNHFEFKEAKNRQDIDEAAKYLCAMSNYGGGRLVLGVTDKRPRKVVGSQACQQPESTVRYFMDKLRIRVDFELYEYEGKRVLAFEIISRPVGLPVQFEGVAWWRDGDSLVPMPEDVRRAIYAEGGHDFSGDVCKGLTIDDLDRNAIEVFRDKWTEYSGVKRIATLSMEQLLRDADVVNDKGVTYAALILFGKREPLLEHLPSRLPDKRQYICPTVFSQANYRKPRRIFARHNSRKHSKQTRSPQWTNCCRLSTVRTCRALWARNEPDLRNVG